MAETRLPRPFRSLTDPLENSTVYRRIKSVQRPTPNTAQNRNSRPKAAGIKQYPQRAHMNGAGQRHNFRIRRVSIAQWTHVSNSFHIYIS
ncbi:hypothetical protein [Nitratireductor sp. XY-223]|uniref:hypothetical protein n=1 Tax=Nitratireductor sp. XY-223 TaxID=2561926 RepID=UPI00145BED2C|nr:hypothetical protein [Nitratireductor sp. XY-223]